MTLPQAERDHRRPRRRPPAEGRSSCERRLRTARAPVRSHTACARGAHADARRRPPRCASCTSGSARSTARIRPGTPHGVDEDNEWGIAAFTGRSATAADAARAAGRAVHADRALREARRRPVVTSIVEVDDGANVDRLVETARRPGTAHRDADHHRGGLSPACRWRARSRRPGRGRRRRAPPRAAPGRARPRPDAERAAADGARRVSLSGLDARRRAGAGRSRSCRATTCPTTAPSCGAGMLELAALGERGAGRLDRSERRRSCRPPSTASRRRPRPPTSRDGARPRPVGATPRRSSPSRSTTGC